MPLSLPSIIGRLMTVTSMGFPSTLQKIDLLLNDTSVNQTMLMALINSDPLLTAQIIGQANSVSPNDITHLPTAINFLGMGCAHGMIRSTPAIPDAQRKVMASCWTMAGHCAIMSDIILRYSSAAIRAQLDAATLSNAALLHDLGTLTTIAYFPEEYRLAASQLTAHGPAFDQLMRQHLGADPTAIGALIATHWRLPQAFVVAMRYHQQPQKADHLRELVAIVHLARFLVRALGYTAGADIYLERLDETVFSQLEVPYAQVETILNEFYDRVQELEMFEAGIAG
jgi:HD-like signal output (HDOD) protein